MSCEVTFLWKSSYWYIDISSIVIIDYKYLQYLYCRYLHFFCTSHWGLVSCFPRAEKASSESRQTRLPLASGQPIHLVSVQPIEHFVDVMTWSIWIRSVATMWHRHVHKKMICEIFWAARQIHVTRSEGCSESKPFQNGETLSD